ncbi:MAG: hypothetical protein MUP44_08725 [Anaerolineales bacterium]|nr:hypothetical protein [Anaerolineales bacterium]
MDILRTLILPASVTPLAREIAATLSPAGAGMWTTGLAPTAEGPATHYISTGYISPEFAHMVPEQFWEQDEDGEWVQTGSEPGSPEAVTEACTAAGMEVTLEQVEAVFAVADVTEQEPFAAMGRLGLMLVQEPIDAT